MEDHRAIIYGLGGPTMFARAIGCSIPCANMWCRRGIPALRWHDVTQLPGANKLGVTMELLKSTSPRTRALVA